MKQRNWFATLRWMLIAWALVYLLLDNLSLTLQQASLSRQFQHLERLDVDQQQVIETAKRRLATAKTLEHKERLMRRRLAKMSAWAVKSDDMVVRSGERFVGQGIRLSDQHTRLLLFIPHVDRSLKSDHKVKFAFAEAWGADRSDKGKSLASEDPSAWKTAITLESIMPGLNQIDFVMEQTSGRLQFNIIVNEKLQKSYPFQSARADGCSYGGEFKYAFPNQIDSKVLANPPRPLNELMCRTFNLVRQSDSKSRGDVIARCWLQSSDHNCISAIQAAAQFPDIVASLLAKGRIRLENICSLFSKCDKWGRAATAP